MPVKRQWDLRKYCVGGAFHGVRVVEYQACDNFIYFLVQDASEGREFFSKQRSVDEARKLTKAYMSKGYGLYAINPDGTLAA